MRGAERASEVRAIMGKRPSSSEIVAARFGVPVYTVALAGRLRAVYLDGAIGLRFGLAWGERQHLILHEMAHHLMHPQIAAARFFLSRDGATLARIEREAEEFAYHFVISDDELGHLAAEGWDDAAIAAHYGRSASWVCGRRHQPVGRPPLAVPPAVLVPSRVAACLLRARPLVPVVAFAARGWHHTLLSTLLRAHHVA